jgi:hypothetical protein
MPNSVPQLPSCVNPKPFVKLGNGATAPSLNYSVPQRTSFSAYGNIQVPIPDVSWFTDAARNGSTLNLTLDEVRQKILDLAIYPNLTIPAFLQVLTPASLVTLKQIYVEAKKNDPYADFSVYNFIPQDTAHTYGGLYSAMDFRNFIDYLAALVMDPTNTAIAAPNFGNFGTQIFVLPVPERAEPAIFVIEEYKTSSFLGDYGAGETVNTFSLLPGEKHTISIKTFRQRTSTATRSDNVMDSFSQASAAEFENLVQEEKQRSTSNTQNNSKESGLSLSVSSIPLLGGIFGGGASRKKSKSSTEVRTSNTSSLSKALQKHSDSTNSSRTITVNSTTSDTLTESTEESTQREIVNPNLSRVLNFVFRQLLQEYISVTYLNDIKIVFSNGYPGSYRMVNIEELDSLLEEVIDGPVKQQAVRDMIFNEYHQIENYKGDAQVFIQKAMTRGWDSPPPIPGGTIAQDVTYMHKKKSIVGSYTYDGADGPRQFTVEGPILNVDLNTLRTDSLIVDALLGQGEALDCFNSHAQNAKTQALYIENAGKELANARQEFENAMAELQKDKTLMAMNTLNQIADPAQRAELYAKIFNPQVQNIIT